MSRDRQMLGAVCVLLATEAVTFAVLLPYRPKHILWLEVVGSVIFLAAVLLLTRVRLPARQLAALII
ncbi:MAG TPA: hypothetical protein VEL02_06795, partial [Jatrophihabitantaceae bacterium]|nr:hypothetical protein [Jatrophihabitantaceae bacterium]